MEKRFLIQWFPERAKKYEQFYEYAKMYREALFTLVKEMNREHNFLDENASDLSPAVLAGHDYGILPAMFLFRHHVELQLKGLVLHKGGTLDEVDKIHGIGEILVLLESKTEIPRISEKSKKIIQELHRLDTTSQGFRYPYDKHGKRFFEETSNDDLVQANIMEEFMDRVEMVTRDLENQEGDFTNEDDSMRFVQ